MNIRELGNLGKLKFHFLVEGTFGNDIWWGRVGSGGQDSGGESGAGGSNGRGGGDRKGMVGSQMGQ